MNEDHRENNVPIPAREPEPAPDNQDSLPDFTFGEDTQENGSVADSLKAPETADGNPQKDLFAVSGFILGLISVVCCGFVLGIPGLVFSIKGLKSTKKNFSMAGLVLSALGSAITTLVIIFILFMRSTILKYGST